MGGLLFLSVMVLEKKKKKKKKPQSHPKSHLVLPCALNKDLLFQQHAGPDSSGPRRSHYIADCPECSGTAVVKILTASISPNNRIFSPK